MSVPLAYIGVILVWSTTPIAIKWSGEEVGFLFGVSARMLIGLALGAAIMLWLKNRHMLRKDAWQSYVAVGLPLYVAMTSVYWGAQYISSGLISVLFGLTPIFTALVAHFWLRENHFTPLKISGMLLGVLGLWLIFRSSVEFGPNAELGVLGVLIAVVVHAFSMVWVKATQKSHTSPLSTTVGGLCVAVPLFSGTWFVVDGKLPQTIPDHTMMAIVYLGVVGSVFGAIMYFYALKHVDAGKMALLTLITPVLALMIGHVLNHEAISNNVIMGTTAIISGLALFQWSGYFAARKAGKVGA